MQIVDAVVKVNDSRKRRMGRKVLHAPGEGEHRGRTVALLGLTFKPNTDDIRDAPAIVIPTALADAGAIGRAYNPKGMDAARMMMPRHRLCTDPYEAATDADAFVIVTEWDAFRLLDLPRLKRIMTAPVLLDLRNVDKRAAVGTAGFDHTAIGR